jgi:rhodanese-related sulfurtransferase
MHADLLDGLRRRRIIRLPAVQGSRDLIIRREPPSPILETIHMRRALVAFVVAASLVPALANAQGPARTTEPAKEKQARLGKYLSATEAHDLLAKEASSTLFLDVRTRGEVQFVGVPAGLDGHVPYAELNEFGDWDGKAGRYRIDLNSNFARDVAARLAAKKLGKDAKILLICRSGDRSARAANLLADLGYSNVYTLYEGFEGDMSKDGRRSVNGWKNAGLPWTYKLAREQAYIPQK